MTKTSSKTDVWQGTLALMILKTLEALGPLHGYGVARRIEQTSGDLLAINYGTLYPQLKCCVIRKRARFHENATRRWLLQKTAFTSFNR